MAILLAFIAGGLIAVQAGINSQLGVMLRNPMFATVVAFVMSALVSSVAITFIAPAWPTKSLIKTIPVFLWFGGVLSAVGVGLFYYLIPKMGVGSMMSFALTGQLLLSVLISHYGLFGLPQIAITPIKLAGIVSMIVGLILLNR
ncbi:DMT family transporter [Alteromonas sp. CYL-A6]|uniref:DMT family transporter n=1 Tax=Alteromonas nitratireducens TaxID=3390813 RepID=UPI0034B44BDC